MHLIIQNTNQSKGNFVVKDEKEVSIFTVKGKARFLSRKKNKLINDFNGNTIYKIKPTAFRGAVIKDAAGNKMKLKHKSARKTFFVLKGAPYEYRVAKDPEKKGRVILRNGEIIATYNRFGSGFINDRYNIEYNDNFDLNMIVALIIAMDNIKDKDDDIRNIK